MKALSLVFLSTSAASIVSNSTNTTSVSPQAAKLIQFPSHHLRGARAGKLLIDSPEETASLLKQDKIRTLQTQSTANSTEAQTSSGNNEAEKNESKTTSTFAIASLVVLFVAILISCTLTAFCCSERCRN